MSTANRSARPNFVQFDDVLIFASLYWVSFFLLAPLFSGYAVILSAVPFTFLTHRAVVKHRSPVTLFATLKFSISVALVSLFIVTIFMYFGLKFINPRLNVNVTLSEMLMTFSIPIVAALFVLTGSAVFCGGWLGKKRLMREQPT